MSNFIPSQDIIAKAFAIAGLALVAPSTYFFRNYSRVLDYVQLFYAFALAYATTTNVFSINLGWGSLTFMENFISSYCNPGEFICVNGFLISPAIAWFGVTFLMLLILGLVGLKKSSVKYQSFYNFWKGIFRWFSVPLIFVCTAQIIASIQTNFNYAEVNFDSAVIVAAIIVAWILVEVIGYARVEKSDQNWKKWCDFFSHFRIHSIVALIVISKKIDIIAQYFIYGPIIIYDVVFLLKYKFHFRTIEKIAFIIQEAVLITIFSLFIFGGSYIYDYNLDLFGLAIVILVEFMIGIPKFAVVCKNGDEDPEPSVIPDKKQATPPYNKRINPYDNVTPEISRSNFQENPALQRSPKGRK